MHRRSVQVYSSEVQFLITWGSQFSSSPPSAQSLSESQRQRSGIHLPSLHLLITETIPCKISRTLKHLQENCYFVLSTQSSIPWSQLQIANASPCNRVVRRQVVRGQVLSVVQVQLFRYGTLETCETYLNSPALQLPGIIGQESSSVQSPQSLSPSHWNSLRMHFLLSHWNSLSPQRMRSIAVIGSSVWMKELKSSAGCWTAPVPQNRTTSESGPFVYNGFLQNLHT